MQGTETVLGLAAVYAAVRYIADAIASLPLKVYRQLPDGTTERVFSTMLLGSPIAGGGPQISGTLYDWLFTGSTSALLWGNAWGLVTNRAGIPGQDGLGLPTGISWLPPDRISVTDDEMQPENPMRAKIYYNGRLMDRSELVHLPAFTVAGRVEGISPIHAFATLIGQGLGALKYSADWFENGGFPPGTFKNVNEEVDEGQAKEIRRRLTDTIRMRQPLVFGRDWEYKEIVVPPNEAAFIQAMQLNATQIAAIYGVQPHRVGGTRADGLTYSNVTMNQLDELQSTLRPWLTRWEHLLTMLLPSTQYAKFDVDALLKTDPHTRNQIYQIQRTIGTRTQNELRAEDDKSPLPGGEDAIPLQVLERMATTTRALPKSIMPQLLLEVDHIAALLEDLQAKGLTAPPPPDAPAAGDFPHAQALTGGDPTPTPDSSSQPASQQPAASPPASSQPASGGSMQGDSQNPGVTAANSSAAIGVSPEQYLGRLLTATRSQPSGVPPRFGDDPKIRASDADRAKARKLLAIHQRAGRLRGPEFDERNRKAGEAVTCGDLGTLFTDLPADEMAASPPEEDRSGVAPPQPLFGPAAMVLLQKRATQFDPVGQLAATNGKAH